VPEEALLSALGKDEKDRNRFRFFLMVNSAFFRERETNDFLARWHIDAVTAKHIHDALSRLYSSCLMIEVISEGEFLTVFLMNLRASMMHTLKSAPHHSAFDHVCGFRCGCLLHMS